MLNSDFNTLPIAVRIYPVQANAGVQKHGSPKLWRSPKAMFVFDTETRIDATQRLTFGSYRFTVDGECMEEAIFYADDLPENDRNILRQYVFTHRAETARGGNRQLKLLTRSEFLDRVYKAVYKGRCLLVGFNLPFDLARIAFDMAIARGRYAGGFSLGLWSYVKDNIERRDNYRPRVLIKHIDSKRALKGFTARNSPDKVDLIPEDTESGENQPGQTFRGHFLDLRTLAFALTDRGYSLETACEAFCVKHGKQRIALHGEITEAYIDYNRRDVLATHELAIRLLEEYDRHPVALQFTKAYSPASIGKAYLRAMQIEPIAQRQPDFPKSIMGHAQSTFFGGRTSAHIRKFTVPVVYTDFLSMYPTVNSLMGLWKFVIARKITVLRNCVRPIQEFLKMVTIMDMFVPATWESLPAFVKLVPNGDVLPVRGKFSESNDWQVALNHLYGTDHSQHGLWFALPDVVASVLLTGKVPIIRDAFRLDTEGVLTDLKPIKLRGQVEVDPRQVDFFRVAIEERKRLKNSMELDHDERERLDRALKVLANATSYGIYAEMNRQESDDVVQMTCHGIDPKSFNCRVSHPEVPGEYCFPPLASLITSAARLMLALLESSVSQMGGTYAMEDTDSMAIVATERGGLIGCPGGCHRPGRKPAVMALSWRQVESIRDRFASLNPYDRSAIPGSILKIEDDNYDSETKQRHLYCYAISAKRYALFIRDKNNAPVLLEKGVNNADDRWSEHGLGHLLNPTDPDSEDRKWIKSVWLDIIREAEVMSAALPSWAKLPAVGRVTISSPAVMRPFTDMNRSKPYCDQIKPFNFVLTCHVNSLGHPDGADPEHFHLIAPYSNDSKQWLKSEWIDRYSDRRYWITTAGHHGTRGTARVKNYAEVLEEYRYHPEAKYADCESNICDRQTVGLLQRRHVRISQIKYIGKESNSIEDVESGMIASPDSVYTEYPDPRRDEWQTLILPALRKWALADLTQRSGLSRRTLIDLRAGRSRPHPKNVKMLAKLVREIMDFTHEPAESRADRLGKSRDRARGPSAHPDDVQGTGTTYKNGKDP